MGSLVPYELERQKNIEHNELQLQALGLPSAGSAAARKPAGSKPRAPVTCDRRVQPLRTTSAPTYYEPPLPGMARRRGSSPAVATAAAAAAAAAALGEVAAEGAVEGAAAAAAAEMEAKGLDFVLHFSPNRAAVSSNHSPPHRAAAMPSPPPPPSPE